MTILNGNGSNGKRLPAYKTDCKHGNDPDQCGDCLRAGGVKVSEPDRAALRRPLSS